MATRTKVLTSPSATIRTVAAKRSARLHIHYVHTHYSRKFTVANATRRH